MLPLKNNELSRGVVIGNTKFQRTLYVPAGIAAPDVTTTSVDDNVGSGIYPSNNTESQGDVPTSTVMLFITSLTPASGIQTV